MDEDYFRYTGVSERETEREERNREWEGREEEKSAE